MVITLGVVTLKLLVFLVLLPLKLIGSISAFAGGLLEIGFALGALCLIGAAIALVLLLLPVAAIGALAIALVC